jgi:hypothetical protein
MATSQDISDNYGISLEQVRQLREAMSDTWCNIAGDYLEACGGESEALEIFETEAAMVAEATIDADRIRQYSREDIGWLYRNEDGTQRTGLIQLAEEVWECTWYCNF